MDYLYFSILSHPIITNNFHGSYFNAVVVLPVTFEQLRTTSAGQGLRTLVEHLSMECSHPAIVNALL